MATQAKFSEPSSTVVSKAKPEKAAVPAKPQPGIALTRRQDGTYAASGASAKLTNRHPTVKVQAAPGRPKHLTPAQIEGMVRLMKVA